jgi:hypothetical protein
VPSVCEGDGRREAVALHGIHTISGRRPACLQKQTIELWCGVGKSLWGTRLG